MQNSVQGVAESKAWQCWPIFSPEDSQKGGLKLGHDIKFTLLKLLDLKNMSVILQHPLVGTWIIVSNAPCKKNE